MLKKFLMVLFIAATTLTCAGHHGTSFFSNRYDLTREAPRCDPSKPFPQLVTIPYFKRASQLIPRCEIYPNHKVAFALTLFYHNWIEEFGDFDLAVKEMVENVMIEWGEKVKVSVNGYHLDGKPIKNHNIIGRVMSPSMIWVFKGHKEALSETALIHELVHLAIRAQLGNGHGDPDHEGSKYSGWTIAHTRMIDVTKGMLRVFSL